MTYLHLLIRLLLMALVGLFALSCSRSTDQDDNNDDSGPDTLLAEVQYYTYSIINSYPHDPFAFTQGLEYENDTLYEGTGNWSSSSLRKLTLETYDTLLFRRPPKPESGYYFGEGITIFGDRIYQLTWTSHICFVYDKYSFDSLGQFTYSTEGWGLTHDDSCLIMSDGSANLYFRNPETFEELRRVEVTDSAGPVRRLNELEYINGEVWANIWYTDRIAQINPATGHVVGWIDLTGLVHEQPYNSRTNVLNGIAYDTDHDRIIVTGKNWSLLFEIELVPQD